MAATLRSSVVSNAASVTVPAGTVAGDLLLIIIGIYSSQVAAPAGFTAVTYAASSGSGTYTDYSNMFWKIAVTGDLGSTISLSTGSGYLGQVLAVFTGHDPTSPVTANSQGGSTTSITVPALTTTKAGKRFVFLTQMANSSSVPTLSVPAGWSIQQSIGGASGYHAIMLASSNTANEAAGTFSSVGGGSNLVGGNVGVHFSVNNGNVLPNAPTGLASNSPVMKGNPLNISWTHNDPDANPQSQYQIRYRAVD